MEFDSVYSCREVEHGCKGLRELFMAGRRGALLPQPLLWALDLVAAPIDPARRYMAALWRLVGIAGWVHALHLVAHGIGREFYVGRGPAWAVPSKSPAVPPLAGPHAPGLVPARDNRLAVAVSVDAMDLVSWPPPKRLALVPLRTGSRFWAAPAAHQWARMLLPSKERRAERFCTPR